MMGGSTKSERATPAGATRRDLAVAVVLVLLGVTVIGLGLRVEAGVQTDPLGPGAFPLALGAGIAAGVAFFASLYGARTRPPPATHS